MYTYDKSLYTNFPVKNYDLINRWATEPGTMRSELLPFLFPYFVSCLISLGVCIHAAWHMRRVAGAFTFAVFAFAQSAWTLFYAFELAGDKLDDKIFWDALQWIALAVMSAAVPVFTLRFTRRTLTRASELLFNIIPALFVGVLFFDGLSSLIYPDAHMIESAPFNILNYSFTPITWAMILYSYVISALSLGWVSRKFLFSRGIYRGQVIVIVMGLLIPLLGSIPGTFFDMRLHGQRDMTPLLFAVGNIVIGWGLFRWRLFDLSPVWRDHLVEQIRGSVVVVDIDNQILDLNQTAKSYLPEALHHHLTGKPLKDVFPKWSSLIEQSTEANIAFSEEIDGDTLHFDLQNTPIYDARGQFAGRLLIIRDTTHQIVMRDALIKNNRELLLARERYHELVSNIPGMTYAYGHHLDNTPYFEFVSSQSRALYHVDPQAASKDPSLLRGRILPEYLVQMDELEQQSKNDLSQFHMIAPVVIDNELRWREWISTPRRLKDGTTLWHGIELDITERKEAEMALQQSEELYRLLTEHTTDMIGLHSLDGYYTFASPACERTLGYSLDEMKRLTGKEFLHPDDLPRVKALRENQIAKRQTVVRSEHRVRKKSGEYIWVEMSSHLICDAQGIPVSLMTASRNITEQREIEMADRENLRLQTALQKESELSSLKTQMMIRIGHEFRTPLSVILLSAQVLDRYLDRMTPEQRREKVDQIYRHIKDLTQMLDAINLIVRGQSADVAFTTFSVADLCAEIAADFQKQRTVEWSVRDVETIKADHDRLHTMLAELVSNAIKFSAQDKPVHLDIFDEGDDVVLCVSDEGIGIPAEELEWVLEPFYRATNIGEISGLGLGLAIVRNIVDMHGGSIHIENQRTGTQVTVRLAKTLYKEMMK